MKVLNLYACLGGNRFLWDNCEVTAVELDRELARLYQLRFANDKVIVADAHQYLLDNYYKFDFVWSSPPCPSHSKARYWNASNLETNTQPIYPDMILYQEIIFLEHYFKGKWCVENVEPYYQPLIPGNKRGRHIFWTNFAVPQILSTRQCRISGNKDNPNKDELKKLCEFHGIDLSAYKGHQRKDKIARNLVDYEAGLTIFNAARNTIIANNIYQPSLFNY